MRMMSGEYYSKAVVVVSFIMIFITLAGAVPTVFYTSGVGSDIVLPDEFSAWSLSSNYTDIEHTLVYDSINIYDFRDASVSYHNIHLWWGSVLEPSGGIQAKRYVGGLNFFPSNLMPNVGAGELIGAWDSTENVSRIKLSDNRGYVIAEFEDLNTSRNGILAAFTDHELNCTITYYGDSSGAEQLGAKEIVFSLLGFKLPEIYTNIHPLVGAMISIIFYVPIAFLVFLTITELIHG